MIMFTTLVSEALWAFLALATIATSSFPTYPPFSPSTVNIPAMQRALILAPSELDRQQVLLPNPPDSTNITYQFVNTPQFAPSGGSIDLASVDKFPALIGTSVSIAIGFVDACGLNVPHSHPRANEILTVVSGTLIAGLVLEQNPDSAGTISIAQTGTTPTPMVLDTLTNYTAMLFPQGNVHFQFNPTCQPAVFLAAFDNNDSGRIQIANTFFSIQQDDVLRSAVGNSESLSASQLDALRGHIPDSYAELMSDCANACNIPTYGGY